MKEKEEHLGKMEAELKMWGAKLDDLAAEAEQAGSNAKMDYQGHIEDIKLKHQAAKLKLDALRDAGSDKWENFKTDIENAWSDLAIAFKNLKN